MTEAPWFSDDAPFFPFRAYAQTEARPWPASDEGALAVDVHEDADAVVVRAPIAGVRPGDLDLSLHNDMLTIRGMRTDEPASPDRRTLHRECHWGAFSRSVILPVSTRADEATASLKDGVLTIRLPKATRHGQIPLTP